MTARRARLVWRYRRWRAAHRYWAADLAYRRRPARDTEVARDLRAWDLRRHDDRRP